MKLSEAIGLCEELAQNEDGSHYARALRVLFRKIKCLRAELKESRETNRIAIEAHKDTMAKYASEHGMLVTRMDGRIAELERELADARRLKR